MIIAENPKLLRRLFLVRNFNEFGFYQVKLCFRGEWQTISMDDFFPCYPLYKPIFTNSNNMDFWVLLLEKAFAKYHGNYITLEEGSVEEGMYNLTGCPTFTNHFQPQYSDL